MPLPMPMHPTLAEGCRLLDRALDLLEQRRQDDANEAVAMHVALRGFRDAGLLDTDAMPPTIRRLTENMMIAAIRSTKGMRPDDRTSLIRSVFLAMRKVAEAYEAERTPDAPDLDPT